MNLLWKLEKDAQFYKFAENDPLLPGWPQFLARHQEFVARVEVTSDFGITHVLLNQHAQNLRRPAPDQLDEILTDMGKALQMSKYRKANVFSTQDWVASMEDPTRMR